MITLCETSPPDFRQDSGNKKGKFRKKAITKKQKAIMLKYQKFILVI